MIRDAVQRTSSFNIIHYESGTKIDMFVNGTSVLDRAQFERRIRQLVDLPDLPEPFNVWIPTPEDQILRSSGTKIAVAARSRTVSDATSPE